ncbi:hypothetical protein JTE90_010132 [Oedothorax gibbosus]|uniref:Uncharacterized protein n=1 Tax=Oedothorax gibbosus TaxID=931172 RepID=A0AAV6UH67_9ARAC|nr:hypothetical protein JTE90_010132 [Oedothorax gibbosus]
MPLKTLTSIGIEVLKNNSLNKISDSLEDLHIEDALQLREIEANALQGCKRLRTLHITRAPKLKRISDGVFAAHFPSFKMLRIAHSGLEVIPNMNQLRTDPTIIAMIDFDSNNIRNITSGSVKVKAENFILDHNEIEVIQDWSFHDSQIANLSFKGNTKLRLVTEDAFFGLKNLRSLDLSGTSITRLPTRGLSSLEVLKLTDVLDLWEFPSVLHFPDIKEAYLTYSYHCCAFRFPVTHDPKEFSRLQSLHRDVHRRYCASTDHPLLEIPSTTTQESTRRRRHVSTTTGEVEDTGGWR